MLRTRPNSLLEKAFDPLHRYERYPAEQPGEITRLRTGAGPEDHQMRANLVEIGLRVSFVSVDAQIVEVVFVVVVVVEALGPEDLLEETAWEEPEGLLPLCRSPSPH